MLRKTGEVDANDLPVSPTSIARLTPRERTAFLDALTKTVRRERAYLVSIARREGLTSEDALDAVQEAFFKLLGSDEAPRLVLAETEARALLATFTRNQARNQRRLHARAKPHDSDPQQLHDIADADGDSDALVERAEEHLRVIGCVRTLAKVQRAVVTLRLLDELPGEDVARQLELEPGHVAVLLHRAKKHLQACLEQVPSAASPA